ncbi:MAG: ImmA/IrrE family metallo-endopeptidase [Silvibacterium sp.]
MIKEKLEEKAEKTLRETDTYRIPIAIEVLAHRLNLAIQSEALGENLAGMLVVEGDRGAIGYNSTHALVRQRFTIAHEISHYLLHIKKNRKSQLFIDRHLTFRRDGYSSGGVDYQEVEANHLGAALLMPRGLVRQEIKKNDLDLDDEEAITFLAKRFHVSSAAITNRLMNLQMLR